jgi:hypothetical protein
MPPLVVRATGATLATRTPGVDYCPPGWAGERHPANWQRAAGLLLSAPGVLPQQLTVGGASDRTSPTGRRRGRPAGSARRLHRAGKLRSCDGRGLPQQRRILRAGEPPLL